MENHKCRIIIMGGVYRRSALPGPRSIKGIGAFDGRKNCKASPGVRTVEHQKK